MLLAVLGWISSSCEHNKIRVTIFTIVCQCRNTWSSSSHLSLVIHSLTMSSSSATKAWERSAHGYNRLAIRNYGIENWPISAKFRKPSTLPSTALKLVVYPPPETKQACKFWTFVTRFLKRNLPFSFSAINKPKQIGIWFPQILSFSPDNFFFKDMNLLFCFLMCEFRLIFLIYQKISISQNLARTPVW